MASLTPEALEKMVVKMKELGVLQLQADGLSIVLDPSRLYVEPPPAPPPPLVEKEQERKDGLTPAEQIELYGRTME